MKHLQAWLSFILLGVVVNLWVPLPTSAQAVEKDIRDEAEEARRALELFLREQQVFFRKGELGLELGSFYSTDRRQEFVRVGAGVALAEVTNRSALTTFMARYVPLTHLEFDVEIPFGYAERNIDFGVVSSQADAFGLGDIVGRVRYQLWQERGARPALTLELNGKSVTGDEPLLGTGNWDVGVRITLIKTLDPVVFFGSLGYTHTLEREGRDPGDRIPISLGMGYSLNDRVSFNMQVIGAHVGKTKLKTAGDGVTRTSALEVISLQFGVTVLVTERLFIEPLVSFGLTDDAVDVVAGISIPFSFQGFLGRP
jgi:hypothetical protein